MKFKMTLAAIAVALATPALAADPVLGIYKTQPGDDGKFGFVELYDCDGAICGVIRRAFDASGAEVPSKNIGKRMLWDMKAEGSGSYSGGKIWAPDRDKTYKSSMELSGASLTVSGCVFVVCRDQKWTRVN
jgi:uncharacterized protein (DUF2147 family)